MKSRLYYVLYFLYVIVVAFVLYLNGVFTGEEISVVNLSINVGFLIVIGIVFIISSGGLTGSFMIWKTPRSGCRRNIRSPAGKISGAIIRITTRLLRKKCCRMHSTSTVCG